MAAARSEPPADRRPEGRFEWERLLRRLVISWRIKGFALLLSTYADPDGTRVRPGVDVLAAVSGQGQSTVKRLLRELCTLGLLEMTRRGGGRGGTGRTNSYRLTLPADLIDRFDMLSPGEKSRGLRDHLVVLQSEPSPVDNSDSEVTEVIPQSNEAPVDNSALEDHPGDLSMVIDNDFQVSLGTDSERLRGQSERLVGHLGDLLPPTRPTTKDDHPTNPDPAQPDTAPAPDRSQEDQAELSETTAAPLHGRCAHNLVRRNRPDGKPACAFCRRDATRTPP